MTFRETLSRFSNNVQYTLFPDLETRLGPLSLDYRRVVTVLELVRIEEFLSCTRFCLGRPSKDRAFIARAFIAKILLKIPHTKQLILALQRDRQLREICGWEAYSKIPSAAKFSRAFQEFTNQLLPEKVHQTLISNVLEDKMIGHLVKDSTPLIAREKPKRKKGSSKKRKREADRRYELEKAGKKLSRRQKQLDHQSLEEMLQDLPKDCDIGAKKNAQGLLQIWNGYKLHVAIGDHCLPIAAILTSASLNDCEVGIPLAEKANQVVQNFYDLMDSAYDIEEIKEHSRRLGHVSIIDRHSRSKAQKAEKLEKQLAAKTLSYYTAEEKRYKERMPKERFNATFKDFYGGRGIFYKGHAKVFCHVMFGIVALTATTLIGFL